MCGLSSGPNQEVVGQALIHFSAVRVDTAFLSVYMLVAVDAGGSKKVNHFTSISTRWWCCYMLLQKNIIKNQSFVRKERFTY